MRAYKDTISSNMDLAAAVLDIAGRQLPDNQNLNLQQGLC
jgi:hypothetical protein